MSAPQHWRKAIIDGKPCLVPADDVTREWLQGRAAGAGVALTVDHVRNAERSALYWVLCGIVAENSAEKMDREAASDTIKIMTGHVRAWSATIEGGSRAFFKAPRSISFASMKEDAFEVFFDRALEVIATELLPGVDVEELRREAYLNAGVTPRSRTR